MRAGRLTGNGGGDTVDVPLVVRDAVVGNGELAVGGQGVTVTVGEVVNDNLDDVCLAR